MPERSIRQSQTIKVSSVRMGEIVVGGEDELIKSLLGSCIGLAVHDRIVGIGGLAHIVLPSSEGYIGPPGKFADTAISELIRRIEEQGGCQRNMVAKLAGGARMFHCESSLTVGERNLETIKRHLQERSIPVCGQHCGGTSGRRMVFYPRTGRVTIGLIGEKSIEI